MNAEITYKTVVSMLKAYDLHTGNAGAESVIRNPHPWTTYDAPALQIYQDAARILVDCLESMEKKTTPAQVLAAVKRIIKEAPANDKRFSGIFTRPEIDGYFLLNGYSIIMLTEDIKAAPHVPDDVETIKVDRFVDEIGAATGDLLELPTVAQLKAFIQAEKARGYAKARGYKDPRPVCIADFWYCNPQYLADILTIIPDARAIRPASWKSPLYIHGSKACGMLLPINASEKIRNNAAIRQELKAA